MQYIATIFLVLMSIVLMVCGVKLWRRRQETGDYSRYIQAVFSWVSALFASLFIIRTWTATTAVDQVFLEPEHTFMPMFFQLCYFLYPLEVIRSTMSRIKLYALLFVPPLLLVFVGMCAGIDYTPLYTYADLWQHIDRFDVWFRLLSLVVLLSYCFSLFLVPYDWHRSSADRRFIFHYACGFCIIGLLYVSIQLTHLYWLQLMHQIAWGVFFITIANYELRERLAVSRLTVEPVEMIPDASTMDPLWAQILVVLNEHEQWRSPELSLTSLSESIGSNRTYVGESFKHNTGMTFVEYITHRRIGYVVEVLQRNPHAHLHELFNYVGYRQRSTAWRNFQKVTGFPPTVYTEKFT